MAKSRDYQYTPPSYEQTVQRAETRGSLFDSLFKDAKIYRPKQGANLLRILPPGWPKASHYGLTLMIHRGVGPNDRQYLCLRENAASPHKRCPVCEELYNLGPKATQEDRIQLRPKASVAYYVIDRDNEKDGVQIWMTSPTTDSEIAAQSVNRRTKSVIDIVHPEDGYDIEFTRTGTTRNNTRYRGFQIMRESSPLSDSDRRADEWLDVAFEKPLPSLLQFYSPEHIEEVFYGHSKEDEEDTKPRTRARDVDDEEEERPQIRRTRPVARDDDAEEETERAPRRRPSRDVDEDDNDREDVRPARSRGRTRDDDDDATNDARSSSRAPARAGRADNADDEEEVEPERPPRSSRSRLSQELDDDIPFDGGRRARPNGRDDGEQEERPARRRRTLDDEQPPETDEHEERRARMRARLNRDA